MRKEFARLLKNEFVFYQLKRPDTGEFKFIESDDLNCYYQIRPERRYHVDFETNVKWDVIAAFRVKRKAL